MMMSSDPYFILMKPNTLEIINKIWTFRAKTGLHLCFTLDAGANVHVLFPESEAKEIQEFIETELLMYCQNEQYIQDKLGAGAQPIKI
jgi:diphosphomevalonate decarboxylase